MTGNCLDSGHRWWRACAIALRNLVTDRSGTTAVEYGVMVAGLSVAIIGIVFVLGDDLALQFKLIVASIESWV